MTVQGWQSLSEVRLSWGTEKLTLKVPGEPATRPRIQVAFRREGVEVERSEPPALWFRDGAWVFELWLVGPRVEAWDLQLWEWR